MKILRGAIVARDQAASQFSAILLRLCESGDAIGAALVDAEGETVDYAGRIDPFDMRVAAAEWRLVLSFFGETRVPGWQHTYELLVRSQKQSFAVWALSEGYAIVLVLPPRAFKSPRRALGEAARELEREAGLAPRHANERLRWLRVDVRTDPRDRRRPSAVWQDGAWIAVTVLGKFQSGDLGHNETGYLTRLASGAELVLVREPLGHWFAGEPS